MNAALPVPDGAGGLLDIAPTLVRETPPEVIPATDPKPAAEPKAEEAPKEEPKAEDPKKEIPDFDPEAPKLAKEEPKAEEAFPKSSQHWKEYKAKKDAEVAKAVQEAEALRKQLAERQGPSNEEVESLKKQLTEFDNILKVTAVERHPQFQKYYDDRAKGLIESAKQIGGEKIAAILQMPEGEHRNAVLREAYAELDPVAQSQVGAVLLNLSALNREKQGELAKAGESYKALQAQKQQQFQAQQEAAKRTLEETIERWSDPERGSPLLRPGAEGAEKIKAQARAIFAGELDNDGMAKASLWAAKGPEMAKMLNGQAKEIAALKQQVAELTNAKPNIDGSTGGTGKTEDLSNKGFLEMFK